MDELEEYLHYVHTWDAPGYEEDEKVASVSEIEEILKDRLVQIVSYGSDAFNRRALYYHDHANGGAMVHVKGIESFGEGTAGLLRVLGCGHFYLNYFDAHCKDTCRQLGQAADDWYHIRNWKKMRVTWFDDDGPMNPNTTCDSEVGIGDAINDVLRAEWNSVGALTGEEKEDMIRKRGVMLHCRFQCFSNPGRDMAAEFPMEYREFLFFHMILVSGWHNTLDKDAAGNKLVQQLCLLNHRYQAPVPDVNMKVDFITPLAVVVKAHQWANRARMRVAARKAAEVTTTREQVSSSVEHSSVQSSSFSHRSVTRGAGWTRVAQSTGYSSSSEWRRYENFRATTWTQTKSGGAMVKVIGQQWRPGCKGCPAQPQTRVTQTGRRRTCKWVTVKRTLLVKRPAVVRRG